MARDGGIGFSTTGYYLPSVSGSWLSLHTLDKYCCFKADVDNSEIYRQTMNSNRLAVFAASLQCTEEVKLEISG